LKWVDMARQAMKPAMPILHTAASAAAGHH